MKKQRFRNLVSTICCMSLLILMMFMFVNATYTENKDTLVVIEDNSSGGTYIDKNNSSGGDRIEEYESLPQRYANKGKMLQTPFREGSTTSYQMIDEVFDGTQTLDDLDANDQIETIIITSPEGYSSTSGHFNISDVVAVESTKLISDLATGSPVPNWMSYPHYERLSINFTLAFRSNLTTIYLDIGAIDGFPRGTVHIEGATTSGLPDGVAYGNALLLPSTASRFIWDSFTFNTILDPGSYTVVLNASTSDASNRYYWENTQTNNAVVGRDDWDASHIVNFYEWTNYDIPFMISYYPVDASGAPRDFTSEPPSTIGFMYNGIAVTSYNQIPINTPITDHEFSMNTSVRFDVEWLITFANNSNPFDTDSLAFIIMDGGQAYWNISFTTTNLDSVPYSIQDRVFNVTKESDWALEDVLQNENTYSGSIINGSTFVTINAGMINGSDIWTITCSAFNYVEDVWVINPVTLENVTDADLGSEIGVKTKLKSGYTSSLNPLTNTLLNYTSDEVYSNLETPISNPYTAIYSLDPAWGNGIYTIESFYNNETEVGLETTTLTVYTPTYLSQETEFTTSTVMIGDPVYFAVYYNDSLQNQAVTDATVIISPDWISPPTVSYNSTYGFYQTYIGTSEALEGTHTITINASRQLYCSQNNIQFNIQLVSSPPTDVTPPTTTIEFIGTLGLDGWYISDVTVMLSATDDLSGVTDIAYSIDGVNWNIYTEPFPITAEGRPTIFYNSTDGAGNVETTKTATIKIDKTPPETKISLDCTLGLEGWYVSDDVIVTLTATDAHSNVAQTAYSLDGVNWNIYTESFIITTEGLTTVSYHSTDVSGNVEATKTETIKIDKTPPITTLMLGSPYVNDTGTLYVTDATEFTLTATNAGSGVVYTSYRINGGDWIKYDDPFTLVGPDGTYHIDYNSTDTAGNIELTNTTMVILKTTPPKDTTPPTTTITIGEPKYVTDITYVTPDTPFTLEVEDDADLGDYPTVYRIYPGTDDSGTGWLSYTVPFCLTSLTEGTYIIEFYSTDQVGNMETPQSIQVTLFSWNYMFTDSYGRGTILKINTEYELFQFITPYKDYGIRKATIIREKLYFRTIIKRHNRNIRIKRIKQHKIYMKYKDNELRLTALAYPNRDYCFAIAWDVQTGKLYVLKDKPGIR